MLTIFRRHMKDCRFSAKGRRHRHCNCPLSVEGRLHGTMIRRSLDIRGWEAAQKLVREWEAGAEKVEIPSLDEAMGRFIDDLTSRELSPDTIRKIELLREELADHFPASRVDSITADELGKFKESWKVKPSTAIKKLERLRSFFKFCVDRDWITKNPAKALKSPREMVIEKKPYDAWELEKIAWAIPLFSSKGIYGDENVERIRAFVSVLRWTGLRIRDAVQLRRAAVDEFITIRTHKNGKPVQLPIHPEIASGLAIMPPGEFFFWSGYGKP